MATKREIPTITVGQLKRALAAYSDDCELSFGGLEFCQLKMRGTNLVLCEFSETIYLNDQGNVVVENHDR